MDKWDEKPPPKDRIDEVLKRVHLDKKIESLPKRIFTPLRRTFSPEGINLSGGETQKIAMANALFNDKAMLILDEPSSALDAITENELIDSMFDAGRGKTIFYISHRLSAARHADKIIFMSGKTVEAVGTHEELLKTCPGYARMYHAQADNCQ